MEQKKPKRILTEKQLANLRPFSEYSKEELRAVTSKGGRNSGEVRRAKRERREVCDWLNDLLQEAGIYEETIEQIKKKVKSGDLKDALALIALVKLPDTQTNKVVGEIGIQKVFITPEEQKEAENLIEKTYNEQ